MSTRSNTEFNVSVIMPVYNEIKTLESAVSSVLKLAKIYSLELIIVDNCSTDGSKELLQKMKNNVK